MKDILNGLPEIGSLTRDQEVELISEPTTLALHNMREGFVYAKKCCRAMLSDDDIYSAVYEALCKAANNFKPGHVRFFAYAKPYIRGALSTVWREKNVVKRANNSAMVDYISEEIAEKEEGDGSFEKTNGLTGVLIAQKNNKPSEPTCDPEIESIQLREEYKLLEPLLKSELTDKEQTVVALKYKSGLTFQKIGELLDTSRPDIQVTHARALKKLRSAAKRKIGTVK